MHQGLCGSPSCRPVDGWPGPSYGHPGGWHQTRAQQSGLAGGEGALAGGQANSSARTQLQVPQGLCHMPASVPAVKLKMRCRGEVCPGEGELLFWRRRQVLLRDEGAGWPGALPDSLRHACGSASLHASDPTMSSARIPSPSGPNPTHPPRPPQTPPAVRSRL